MFALEGQDYFDAANDNARPQLQCNKGGDVPPPPKQEKVKLPKVPPPLPPPPPPAPPPTTDMAAVDQARTDQQKKVQRQRGLSKTLLAGETGGYQPRQPEGAKKTLLG